MSVPDQSWRDHANCRGMDTEMFYPLSDNYVPPAVATACAACPVRGECLAYAEDMRITDGIWGGRAKKQRRAVQRKGRRAPKQRDDDAA